MKIKRQKTTLAQEGQKQQEKRYSKRAFLTAPRWQQDAPLLMHILQEQEQYSMDEVKRILATYHKKEVK